MCLAQVEIIDLSLNSPVHGLSTSHLDNKHYYKLPHSQDEYVSIVLDSYDVLAIYTLAGSLPYESKYDN